MQGSVCGRPVFAYCLDAAAYEDASCADHASRQIVRLMDMAVMVRSSTQKVKVSRWVLILS